MAVANPLHSVSNDARYVSDVLGSIAGPVVLVGYSYGGRVVSNAAKGHGNVKSLVYVATFAPDAGQAAAMPPGLPSQTGDGHGGFATKGVDQDDQALSAAFTRSGRNG